MKELFRQLVTGVNGDYSSKRFITLISFLLVSIAFISNIFFDIYMKDYVFLGMLGFTASGLGFTALDHFSKK